MAIEEILGRRAGANGKRRQSRQEQTSKPRS
jgi:hypothetical protein